MESITRYLFLNGKASYLENVSKKCCEGWRKVALARRKNFPFASPPRSREASVAKGCERPRAHGERRLGSPVAAKDARRKVAPARRNNFDLHKSVSTVFAKGYACTAKELPHALYRFSSQSCSLPRPPVPRKTAKGWRKVGERIAFFNPGGNQGHPRGVGG